jgi:hypothetical protein
MIGLLVTEDWGVAPGLLQTAIWRAFFMPSSNKSVRIIERKQREASVAGEVVPLAKTERQIEREMALTVASWIKERREGVKELAQSDCAGGLFHTRSNPQQEGA